MGQHRPRAHLPSPSNPPAPPTGLTWLGQGQRSGLPGSVCPGPGGTEKVEGSGRGDRRTLLACCLRHLFIWVVRWVHSPSLTGSPRGSNENMYERRFSACLACAPLPPPDPSPTRAVSVQGGQRASPLLKTPTAPSWLSWDCPGLSQRQPVRSVFSPLLLLHLPRGPVPAGG